MRPRLGETACRFGDRRPAGLLDCRVDLGRPGRYTRPEIEHYAREALADSWEADPRAPDVAAAGIDPTGLRIDCRGRALVPIRTRYREPVNVLVIEPDGPRWFLSGALPAGQFAKLGRAAGRIIITERLDSALVIRRAVPGAVVVAFKRSNIAPVARAVRQGWKSHRLVIAAEAYFGPINAGMTHEAAAARAVGARFAIPAPVRSWPELMACSGLRGIAERIANAWPLTPAGGGL
jgi:phage/plasmid primase-like uncharacterized protein